VHAREDQDPYDLVTSHLRRILVELRRQHPAIGFHWYLDRAEKPEMKNRWRANAFYFLPDSPSGLRRELLERIDADLNRERASGAVIFHVVGLKDIDSEASIFGGPEALRLYERVCTICDEQILNFHSGGEGLPRAPNRLLKATQWTCALFQAASCDVSPEESVAWLQEWGRRWLDLARGVGFSATLEDFEPAAARIEPAARACLQDVGLSAEPAWNRTLEELARGLTGLKTEIRQIRSALSAPQFADWLGRRLIHQQFKHFSLDDAGEIAIVLAIVRVLLDPTGPPSS
jgi:hypothetical protein